MNHMILEIFNLNPYLITLVLLLITPKIVTLIFTKLSASTTPVFLLDFACYKPKQDSTQRALTRKMVVDKARKYGLTYSKETIDFMEQILERSGLGNETYFPEAAVVDEPTYPPTMQKAVEESQEVIFGVVEDLLAKTKVNAKDIGIVIVNCSVFNVVPSLSAMVVNKFKLRDDVKAYNVSGMGCSGGLRCIGLAKNLLKVHKNMLALVVSTENLTDNCYMGNNLSMIGTNCYFRVGGAAMLLTNRSSDLSQVKYQLIHSIDIQTASSDLSYSSVNHQEDEDGFRGIAVNKDLIVSATEAIGSNVGALGRLVLPVHEITLYVLNQLTRRLFMSKRKAYTPNFKGQFEHFLPHVGAKVVLDALEKKLGFSKTQMEASRMTLYRFGNTSSSSIWYELAYIEAKGRVGINDRIWQIAMGSGFKCSSVVWRAMRISAIDHDLLNPWIGEIGRYPVDLGFLGGSYPFRFESN
ncbi:hypothetical protein QQ045_021477 [Rhodiola kirilowii]